LLDPFHNGIKDGDRDSSDVNGISSEKFIHVHCLMPQRHASLPNSTAISFWMGDRIAPIEKSRSRPARAKRN